MEAPWETGLRVICLEKLASPSVLKCHRSTSVWHGVRRLALKGGNGGGGGFLAGLLDAFRAVCFVLAMSKESSHVRGNADWNKSAGIAAVWREEERCVWRVTIVTGGEERPGMHIRQGN